MAGLLTLDRRDHGCRDGVLAHLGDALVEQVVGEHGGALGGHAGQVVEHPADVLEGVEVRERAEDPHLHADRRQVDLGGRPAELDLELVQDQAVAGLLRLPHLGVEAPVDLRRVGQQRGQLEDVAVDLELDPGHVVEHVAEAVVEGLRPAHRVVDRRQVDRRMLVAEPVDVLGQSRLGHRRTCHW